MCTFEHFLVYTVSYLACRTRRRTKTVRRLTVLTVHDNNDNDDMSNNGNLSHLKRDGCKR